MSTAAKFVGEPFRMLESGAGGEPICFVFQQSEHRVIQIVRQWQDFGFSSAETKRTWRQRRHRNYYEIQTDQDAHLLIYFDRGVKLESPRAWVVLERYDS